MILNDLGRPKYQNASSYRSATSCSLSHSTRDAGPVFMTTVAHHTCPVMCCGLSTDVSRARFSSWINLRLARNEHGTIVVHVVQPADPLIHPSSTNRTWMDTRCKSTEFVGLPSDSLLVCVCVDLCLSLTTHALPLPLPLPHHHTLPLPSASLSPPTPSHSPLPLPHHPHPPTPLCLCLSLSTLGVAHAGFFSFEARAPPPASTFLRLQYQTLRWKEMILKATRNGVSLKPHTHVLFGGSVVCGAGMSDSGVCLACEHRPAITAPSQLGSGVGGEWLSVSCLMSELTSRLDQHNLAGWIKCIESRLGRMSNSALERRDTRTLIDGRGLNETCERCLSATPSSDNGFACPSHCHTVPELWKGTNRRKRKKEPSRQEPANISNDFWLHWENTPSLSERFGFSLAILPRWSPHTPESKPSIPTTPRHPSLWQRVQSIAQLHLLFMKPARSSFKIEKLRPLPHPVELKLHENTFQARQCRSVQTLISRLFSLGSPTERNDEGHTSDAQMSIPLFESNLLTKIFKIIAHSSFNMGELTQTHLWEGPSQHHTRCPARTPHLPIRDDFCAD
ncbi:hypothetical protein BLNAU_10754 [Blattamonas nauphoetae]|uniref:Uncharacterized protein n=1 Tax=Blattamonas nauphoetae TaxID=2049346 RepID=A0ABQ9XS44_9EUKA|nr:hypothetical protein BLNAU_10754 [Blattamonas nauphoetae]